MSYFPNSSFRLDVAKGIVSKHTDIRKYGYNASVDTTPIFIKANGGTTYADLPWVGLPTALTVSSSATTDIDTTGTGAQKVTVYGLDTNGDIDSQEYSMNGQTGVSIGSWLRVHRIRITQGGSNKINDGNIYVGYGTITGGVPNNIVATMPIGIGTTLESFYTVPRAHTLYISKYDVDFASNRGVEVDLLVFPNGANGGTTSYVNERLDMYDGGREVEITYFDVITEYTDMIFRGKLTSGAAVAVSASFSGILVDNS